ncbi:hypothetical protein B7486_08000 [cyanobacterium TDX16]|nr:hypothetical protein B7486_08000 [cyanobacterium TDX16]
MPAFADMLYGRIELPEWLAPFLRLPEFLRLRGVRLSNVDSFEFKDFNGPTRWDHGLAVAYLAIVAADRKGLAACERIHLVLAALLHDVGTPPFAHTGEYVIDNFDHETETQLVLAGKHRIDGSGGLPVFASQLPSFQKECEKLTKKMGFRISPDNVSSLVIGEGELGYFIKGTVDLDNADNVTRACLHMGVEVDRSVPIRIARWLGEQSYSPSLTECSNEAVRKWLGYRDKMYGAFFRSGPEELGRQAFLQHLMRVALDIGVQPASIIRATDDEFLGLVRHQQDDSRGLLRPSMAELVERYKLMETPVLVASAEIEDDEILRTLRIPTAMAWIERSLASPGFEPMLLLSRRRFGITENGESLFPPPLGILHLHKLGSGIKRGQLPVAIRPDVADDVQGRTLMRATNLLFKKRIREWSAEKPWFGGNGRRSATIVENLRAVGDWSFRLSRNESIHPYPSTFVYAIPANLICALGLRGELIVDPFGGTGQTAVEAIRHGGDVVTADTNSIALMVARARLTYLGQVARERLRACEASEIRRLEPSQNPSLEYLEKWFHRNTLEELCQIWSYIGRRRDGTNREFLKVCFSAIITSCTGRRGEQHGYFADNSPLPTGVKAPPYVDAVSLFLGRVRRNLLILERMYIGLEKQERDPVDELTRARVVKVDSVHGLASDFGVKPGSVGGIITSPPYLCMADYTLGLRLSYAWLFPEDFNSDFKRELGTRRSRFRPAAAIEEYLSGMSRFAALAAKLVRKGGFVATVLGEPVSRNFANAGITKSIDRMLAEAGFDRIWQIRRRISWHRNHGYARLKWERIAVHKRL